MDTDPVSITVSDPETGQVKTIEDTPDQFVFYGTPQKEGPTPKYLIYQGEVYQLREEQGESASYYGALPITSNGKLEVIARSQSGPWKTLIGYPDQFEFFGDKK